MNQQRRIQMAYKYAYFIRGNQLSLVEKGDTAEDYKSPTKAVTTGLKFEYVKRPLITTDSGGSSVQSGTISETDYIQIDDYLANALVYYLKARVAEDNRDMELKEYYMKEFRAMAGRHYSGQSYGLRETFPGPSAIR
jgi:hypothetical protein